MNTLKNCAKIAAKINVRQASESDEFQHICNGYLEFYTRSSSFLSLTFCSIEW
jgi:hypothetical protein